MSIALVLAQFLAIVVIFIRPAGFEFNLVVITMAGLILIADAFCLALWALVSMRAKSFSVMPEPTAQSELCTTGPYRWIRHPMYTAVLLACFGAMSDVWHATEMGCTGILGMVLVVKLNREEGFLLNRYGDQYLTYQQTSSALVPHLY